jgi:hypothetical protein
VLNILGLDGFTAQLANRLAEQSIVLPWTALHPGYGISMNICG